VVGFVARKFAKLHLLCRWFIFFSQLVTQEQPHPFSRFSRTHYRKKEKNTLCERKREKKKELNFFASFFLGVLLWDLDLCEFCIFLSNGRNSCPFGK
jgi:hypothetical protein